MHPTELALGFSFTLSTFGLVGILPCIFIPLELNSHYRNYSLLLFVALPPHKDIYLQPISFKLGSQNNIPHVEILLSSW
jgi:hypothetical protein